MTARVKNFEIKDGKFYGPAQYMLEQGNDKLDEILAGKNEIFNASAHLPRQSSMVAAGRSAPGFPVSRDGGHNQSGE